MLIKIIFICINFIYYNNFSQANSFDENKYILGKSFFEKPWVSFPASTTARDGLGPLFNQNSCDTCHPDGGRSDKFIIKLDNVNTIYGSQINTKSIGGVDKEADVSIDYKYLTITYPDDSITVIKKPTIKLKNLGYGEVKSTLSMRISPSLHGIGLLEKILNKPSNRFNLTADVTSILNQVAHAAYNDMGLTNIIFRKENCTKKQIKCQKALTSKTLDLPEKRLKAITYFVQNLNTVSSIKPIKLFNKIGCSSCHTPSYRLKNKIIYPYTDLLTHNLGEGKFRTAPLWNNKKQINFWHDGRAKTVEEAILWHQGDAEKSRNKFMQLALEQRQIIINFVYNQ